MAAAPLHPVATATSVMILVERGKLKLDDRLGTLLPEFDNHRKGEITVEQLLRHRSGLIADNPIFGLSNTIVSAHMAGVTLESMDRMAVTTVKNILSVLDGTPNKENAVNREVFG